MTSKIDNYITIPTATMAIGYPKIMEHVEMASKLAETGIPILGAMFLFLRIFAFVQDRFSGKKNDD